MNRAKALILEADWPPPRNQASPFDVNQVHRPTSLRRFSRLALWNTKQRPIIGLQLGQGHLGCDLCRRPREVDVTVVLLRLRSWLFKAFEAFLYALKRHLVASGSARYARRRGPRHFSPPRRYSPPVALPREALLWHPTRAALVNASRLKK